MLHPSPTTRIGVPLNVLAQAFDVLFYLTSAEPVGATVYVTDVLPHRFHEKVPEFALV
jgi:hypothetical protein